MYSEKEEKGEGKKSELKPDKLGHRKNNEGTLSKKASLPGQMYVPTKTLSVDDFAADHIK